MSMQKPIRSMVSAAVISIIASSAVHAGAFSLYTESSAVALGNYAAGIAAEAADASTGWYNPAGLVLLGKQQVVFSGAGVFPSTKLTGTSAFSTVGVPPYVQSFSGLQGGKDAFVPSLHYALPLGERAAFGLSIVSPFGLSTQYDENSPVRYAATNTELLTVNVSPELGAKLTDNFAVGAGLDLQWAEVKFNRMLGAPATNQFIEEFNPNIFPAYLDSLSYNKGHSFGVGFHAGLMTMFNDNHTRLGLNYQSKVKHSFNGYSQLTGRLADPLITNSSAVFRSNSLFSNDVELPNVVTLSGYQDVNDRLALLGSIVYTGWDVFKTIKLNNVAAFSSDLMEQVLVNSTTAENYRNSWRAALGANYQLNQQWKLRVGGGYDQTPTINSARDVRLPDANRWALSVGTHYQMRPSLGFDLGYTYLFAVNDPLVNKTELLGTTSAYNVNAKADVHAQLVGLQVVWTIDQDEKGYK